MIFYRDVWSAFFQLVNQDVLILLARVLTLCATEANIQSVVFTRIELTTSALPGIKIVGVRGYLLPYLL